MGSKEALNLVRQLKHLPGKHPQKSHAGGRGSGSSEDIYMPGRVASNSPAARGAQFKKNKKAFEGKLNAAKSAANNAAGDPNFEDALGGAAKLEAKDPKKFAQWRRGLITAEELAGAMGETEAYKKHEAAILPAGAKQAVKNLSGKKAGDYTSLLDDHTDQSLNDWANLSASYLATYRDDNIIQLNDKFDKVKPYVK